MFKNMMMVAAIAVLAMADGPVVKTGQTTVYKAGDDGTYQAGIARSYTRDDVNEIVADHATHLEWQDDSDANGTLRDWNGAKTYCDSLTLGGKTDWRLPTVEELVSITDRSRMYPSIDPIFQHISSSGFYCSSTTVASDSSDAWYVFFNDGLDYWYDKSISSYVRCVRSGQ